MLVFYSAFNLCYRPLCNALAGDLINIVIWIMNGDDKGKLEGYCRGEMLHWAPGGIWRQEDHVLLGSILHKVPQPQLLTGTQGLPSAFPVQHLLLHEEG